MTNQEECNWLPQLPGIPDGRHYLPRVHPTTLSLERARGAPIPSVKEERANKV